MKVLYNIFLRFTEGWAVSRDSQNVKMLTFYMSWIETFAVESAISWDIRCSCKLDRDKEVWVLATDDLWVNANDGWARLKLGMIFVSQVPELRSWDAPGEGWRQGCTAGTRWWW